MKFPNTVKGLKRIFAGEIIGLISVALLLMASILMVPKAGEKEVNDDAVAVLIFFVSFIVGSFISTIVNGIGLFNLRKDDKYFKRAFMFFVISLSINAFGFFVVPVFFIFVRFFISIIPTEMIEHARSITSDLITVLVSAADAIIKIMVMQGIMSIFKKLGDRESSKHGKKSIYALAILTFVHVLINFIVPFLGGKTNSIEALLLSLPSLALIIAEYVIYLSYIKRMITVLEPSEINKLESRLSE